MAERRTGVPFEPPPWEREQFEKMTGQREAQRSDEAIDQAIQQLDVGIPVKPKKVLAPQLDEGRMVEMLSQLAIDESRAMVEWWRLGLLGSIVTGSIGVMLVVLGAVGMAKVAKAGLMGVAPASILLVFGFGLCGLAVWTAYKTLKQRGVL